MIMGCDLVGFEYGQEEGRMFQGEIGGRGHWKSDDSWSIVSKRMIKIELEGGDAIIVEDDDMVAIKIVYKK